MVVYAQKLARMRQKWGQTRIESKNKSKKMLTDYKPKCKVLIEYSTTANAPSTKGETIGQHEMGHYNIRNYWASDIDNAFRPNMNKCFCEPCFSAIVKALNTLGDYDRLAMIYQDALYDYDRYDGKTKANYKKEADNLYTELINMYGQLNSAINDANSKCGVNK